MKTVGGANCCEMVRSEFLKWREGRRWDAAFMGERCGGMVQSNWVLIRRGLDLCGGSAVREDEK